ncbi:hypothetical protein BH10CHL1_BH10CHL1_43690 [soil metagenome]
MSNSPVQLRRLLWVGPLTIVAAVIAVQIVRFIILALLPEAKNAMQLSVLGISVVFTAVLVLGAVLVFALVARFSARPLALYQRIALIVLIISFIPDILLARSSMPGASWSNTIALMLLHVVAWAVTVWMLTNLTVAERIQQPA